MAKKDAPAESEELEAAPKGIGKLLKSFSNLFSRKDPNASEDDDKGSKSKSGKKGSEDDEGESKSSGLSILTTVAALAGVLVLATLLIFFSISSYQLSTRIEAMNDTVLAVGKRVIELNQAIDRLGPLTQVSKTEDAGMDDVVDAKTADTALPSELKTQLDAQALQLKSILNTLAATSSNKVGLDPATERQIKALTKDLAALLELEKANYLQAIRNQTAIQEAKREEPVITYPPAPKENQ
jgi:hypothetical protein